MRTKSFLLALSALASSVTAFGQNATVTTKASPGLLQLAGSGIDGQILVSANDWWGVIRAAQDLATDFGKVTGTNLTLGDWHGGITPGNYSRHNEERPARRGPQWVGWGGWDGPPHPPNGSEAPPPSSEHNKTAGLPASSETTVYYTYNPTTNYINYTVGPAQNFTEPILVYNSTRKTVIIAETIGKSDVINALMVAQKISDLPIHGKWKSYIAHVVDNPFPRIDRAFIIAGSDMRGTIYGIYDVSEQIGVSPWWWFSDVPIKKAEGVWALGGRKTQCSPSVKYRGFFINDEQPALTNWINDNYAPGPYGPGFNHYFYARVFELLLRLKANYFWPAEWSKPMMRASNEWPTFGSQYGGNGQWAYNSNNASIDKFFRYGAQRAKPYTANSLFTMAMRGSGDTAIGLTDAQAVVVLENVVSSQLNILREVFNGTNVTEIPQMWCLYKEVQGYYEHLGLQVPDHITLLWADDNWGNIRRLPLANETRRAGGAGVYYHSQIMEQV